MWYLYLFLGLAIFPSITISELIKCLKYSDINEYTQGFLMLSIYLAILSIISYYLHLKIKMEQPENNTNTNKSNAEIQLVVFKEKYVPQYLVILRFTYSINYRIHYINEWEKCNKIF